MKIMYMGTPDFAARVLRGIVKERPHDTFCVVTKPDTPKGRSYKLVESETAHAAHELGLEVYKPENLKEENFKQILEKEAPDIIVVAAFGKLLPEYVLNYPKYSCVNVHGSILPEYRGAAPVNRAIMDGKKTTGITIMKMEKGLDTGDMILRAEIPIEESDTATVLFEKLADLGISLMLEVLDTAEREGSLSGETQDSSLATYAEKIVDSDMKIDWTKTAFEIVRKIHGLSEEPGAYTRISSNGKLLKIYRASAGEICPDSKCGEVVLARKKIQVACADASVYLEVLKLEGGKKLAAADFLNGRGIALGDILE